MTQYLQGLTSLEGYGIPRYSSSNSRRASRMAVMISHLILPAQGFLDLDQSAIDRDGSADSADDTTESASSHFHAKQK